MSQHRPRKRQRTESHTDPDARHGGEIEMHVSQDDHNLFMEDEDVTTFAQSNTHAKEEEENAMTEVKSENMRDYRSSADTFNKTKYIYDIDTAERVAVILLPLVLPSAIRPVLEEHLSLEEAPWTMYQILTPLREHLAQQHEHITLHVRGWPDSMSNIADMIPNMQIRAMALYGTAYIKNQR